MALGFRVSGLIDFFPDFAEFFGLRCRDFSRLLAFSCHDTGRVII